MRWSDGNTDNPRLVTVTKDTTLTAEFNGATGMEQTADNRSVTAQKIVRDGQVLILRGDKTYTTMGVEVNL